MNVFRKDFLTFQKKNIRQITAYLTVSVAMYVSIFVVMYIAVDIIGISEMNAYVATYICAYIADYLINLRYLFGRDHSLPTVFKYLIHVAFFLGCGSIVFKSLIIINIHYLGATLLTAIVLLPLRFLAHKYLVFR